MVIRIIFSLLFLFSIEGAALKGSDVAATSTIQSYKRFALVIGNEKYQVDPLLHSIEDARRIRDFLVSKDFTVTYAENATVKIMRKKITEFMQNVTKKSVALIYYSGHGVQEKSETQDGDLTNYLMPINNAELKDVSDLDYESISLNKLLTKLNEKNHGLNIALIDACRTGFPSTKSGSHFIGNIPAKGVYIAYATASGLEASDNGLFSESFIKNASKPLKLQDVFFNVKNDLNHTSQRPMVADGTVGEPFYFTGSLEDNPQVLKFNLMSAKLYEQKAIVAFNNGDKYNDLTEYRKAWLYGLEAKKLKMPQGHLALEAYIQDQLMSVSVQALNPEKYSTPSPLDIGTISLAIAYSPDGSVLASGAADGTIKFWDIKSGRLKRTLKAHSDSVEALSYSADSKILASSSSDGSIKLWEVKSGQLKQKFEGVGEWVKVLSYSPDGLVLAFESYNTIKLLNVKSGQVMQTLEGHKKSIEALSYSPDSNVLASASSDGSIKLWDAKLGQLKQTLKGHEKWVRALSYSADGNVLASASSDGIIKLWETKSGQLKLIVEGHKGSIEALSFSPNGDVLASASNNGTIKLWDVKSGHLKLSFKGDEDGVFALSYSPDGHELAFLSEGKTIKLWDTKSEKFKQDFQYNNDLIHSVSYSPDGSVLASTSYKTIKLWDTKSGELMQMLKGHEGDVWGLSYSPDGRTLASGSADTTIKLWDVKTGYLKQTLKEKEKEKEQDQEKGKNEIRTLSYSPNGRILASGSLDKTIKLWDAKTGQLQQTLEGHEGEILALSYSPDGNVLASGSSDSTIKFWDAKSGQLKQTLKGHERAILTLSYNDDGHVLASGSSEGTIKLWDTASGQLKQTLKEHEGEVLMLSYRPKSNVLASASQNGTINLWDTKLGELKQTLKRSEGGIRALSYNPNGSVLAFGEKDGTINFLDGEARQLKRSFRIHEENVLASVAKNQAIKFLTTAMRKTQDIFYKYDPEHVSAALQFLWEMGLNDKFTFEHKIRTPSLRSIQGHYYSDIQFLSLLDFPHQGKTKMDQLIQWLDKRKAYKNK